MREAYKALHDLAAQLSQKNGGLTMNARFVLADGEVWLLQVEDEGSRWGFYLMDDDGLTYIAKEWTVVPDDQVPADVRERFEHLLALLRKTK